MWSMPRPVLRVVAVILVVCAVGGFALGLGDPTRRTVEKASGPAVAAPDARPVQTYEIAPLPPPPEKAEEEEKADPTETPGEKFARAPAVKTAPLEVPAPPPSEPAPAPAPPPAPAEDIPPF